jgi:hypothetical protein
VDKGFTKNRGVAAVTGRTFFRVWSGFAGSVRTNDGEFISGGDQGAAVGRFESAVAAVGSDDEFGFGPSAVECPGAFHGTNDIVAALHDYAGDVAYVGGVAQQLVVEFEESFIDEVVSFYAGEGQREFILFVVAGKGGVGQEFGGGSFPSAPDFGGSEADGGVDTGEAAMVGREEIAAFGCGDVGQVWLPGVRIKNRGAALVEPVDFLFAQQEDAAENEFGDAIGMSLGIGQGEGGAPGSAEDLPALNAQVHADFFDVGDQVPGGVGFEGRIGSALAAAALVEVHDAVLLGMEEAALFGIGATTGAAVQEDRRLASGIAALFEINFVHGGDPEAAGVEGLDGRVEPSDGILHDGLWKGHCRQCTFHGGAK